MTLTVECKRLPSNEHGSSNQSQQRNYTKKFRITQTDTGARASVPDLITAAQAVMTGDPIPVYGDNWADAGYTDYDAYAMNFEWESPHQVDRPKLLDVTVAFQPLSGSSHGRLIETDVLAWPTEYTVEWTEEQVVLHEAKNVEELANIGRDALTLGKVVNACGIEFTEALMKTVYYPVLQCQKFYEDQTDIIALNITYQDSTNDDVFFGSAARTAKYLLTESGKVQKINGQSCYAGVTRIWFKAETWDRKVLNNGWSHFKASDDGDPIAGDIGPKLYKNMISDNPDDTATTADDDTRTPCSEPLNLSYDGYLFSSAVDPYYISYRHLKDLDYSGIGIGG